jgi:hypothetical protein
MLGWDEYGFHKKRDGSLYAKLVFLHPIRILEIARWDTLHQTCVFASGGICGSHSALRRVQGAKRRRTIAHARVG